MLGSQGKHAKPSSSLVTDTSTDKYHLTTEIQPSYLEFFKPKVQAIILPNNYCLNYWARVKQQSQQQNLATLPAVLASL